MRSFLFNVHVVTSFTIELSSCNQSCDFNHTLIAHIYDRFFGNGFDMLLVCILVIIVLSEDISATKRNFMMLRNLFIKRFFPSFPKSRLESWFTRIFNICRIVLKLPRWLLHSKKLRTRIPIEIQQSLRNKILTLLLENPIWYSM